jgi:hypothetical protein
MSWRICVVLGILMGPLAACDRARCEWPHEADAAVDLTNPIQQRHLRDDAYGARTFAIRYGDAIVILPASPDAEGWNERVGVHRDAVTRCEAALFQAIATTHHVASAQVRALAAQ